jgi:hypothetical protein
MDGYVDCPRVHALTEAFTARRLKRAKLASDGASTYI